MEIPHRKKSKWWVLNQIFCKYFKYSHIIPHDINTFWKDVEISCFLLWTNVINKCGKKTVSSYVKNQFSPFLSVIEYSSHFLVWKPSKWDEFIYFVDYFKWNSIIEIIKKLYLFEMDFKWPYERWLPSKWSYIEGRWNINIYVRTIWVESLTCKCILNVGSWGRSKHSFLSPFFPIWSE